MLTPTCPSGPTSCWWESMRCATTRMAASSTRRARSSRQRSTGTRCGLRLTKTLFSRGKHVFLFLFCFWFKQKRCFCLAKVGKTHGSPRGQTCFFCFSFVFLIKQKHRFCQPKAVACRRDAGCVLVRGRLVRGRRLAGMHYCPPTPARSEPNRRARPGRCVGISRRVRSTESSVQEKHVALIQ